MNKAASGPWFEGMPPEPSWGVTIITLLWPVSVIVSLYCGWQARGMFEANKSRIAAEAPKRMTPAPAAAYTKWLCTSRERAEYNGACAHRTLSGSIKAKGVM